MPSAKSWTVAAFALLASACSGDGGTGLSAAEVDTLLASDFAAKLKGPNQLGFTELEPAAAASEAKAAFADIKLTLIDQTKRYPVILQVGHYPRVPGAGVRTGTQGSRVNE